MNLRGEDATVITVIEKPAYENMLYVVYIEELKHTLLTEAMGRIKFLDSKFNFQKILVDSTGLGAAVVDVLKEDLKQKVVDMYFTNKNKYSMYSHLKLLMEKGKLKIPYNRKLYYEMMDLQMEFGSKSSEPKLHHSPRGHDDYPDSLALAAYGFKDSNNAYVPTIC